jgi:hypothetical protein
LPWSAQPYDSAVPNLGMGAGVDVPLKERKLAERLERDGHNVLLRSVAGCEEQGYEIRRTLALDRQLAALVREPSTSIASRQLQQRPRHHCWPGPR